MRDYARLKTFSPSSRRSRSILFFLLFPFDSAALSSSPSPSFSPVGSRTGPRFLPWNQPGNCSVERARQPAAATFAFLPPGADFTRSTDLPPDPRALGYVIEGRIAALDRDLLMILIGGTGRMSNRFSRDPVNPTGEYCYAMSAARRR